MSSGPVFCPYGKNNKRCRWEKISGLVRDEDNVGVLNCSNCQITKHEIDLRHKINYESGSMHSWTDGYGEDLKGPSSDKDRRLKAIKDLVNENSINSVLDFGCGKGEMLEVFGSNLEIEIMGLEPETNARNEAQKEVLTCLNPFLRL